MSYLDHLYRPPSKETLDEALFRSDKMNRVFKGAHDMLFTPNPNANNGRGGYFHDSEVLSRPGAKTKTARDYRIGIGKVLTKRAKTDGSYGDELWKRTIKLAKKYDTPDPYQYV